ncbi:hypothetical protein [Thermaerobacillus caldiproteolyticus]|uniref:Uncharacterized protein n=1 Tax=Thermaerobacillus caldiproteolyticus TaxID=247480 RepID=A0A7V9Z7K5_9BACL|nr:hypothetical protein [Anoxybacillus caldiproteolyticus]MBA2875509.1 hypothetical protein [Anoxybacillus caldiproteolyticus]
MKKYILSFFIETGAGLLLTERWLMGALTITRIIVMDMANIFPCSMPWKKPVKHVLST